MRVESVMVAQHAVVEDGLLSVMKGGWEHYAVASFPCDLRGCVAGVLGLDALDRGRTPVVRLEIGDDEGHVSPVQASMLVRPGALEGPTPRLSFSIPFATIAIGPTVVLCRLFFEGDKELALVSFDLRLSRGAQAASAQDKDTTST
jgi:hypothetical protein